MMPTMGQNTAFSLTNNAAPVSLSASVGRRNARLAHSKVGTIARVDLEGGVRQW
jgi:hypothetical protein